MNPSHIKGYLVFQKFYAQYQLAAGQQGRRSSTVALFAHGAFNALDYAMEFRPNALHTKAITLS